MYRSQLMLGLSCAALGAGLATAAEAAPATVNGGGAASQYFNYAAPNVNGAPVAEMPLFDTQQAGVSFGTYWSTISGAAQAAMLTNDLTCLENAETGNNGGKCSNQPGGANTVHYGVSESVFSANSVSTWATSTWGQQAAGDLIQIPALGTGLAIPVNDTNLTSNGQIGFSDNDLCGVFSGLITNFSQITDSPGTPAAGSFQLVYRADSAGTTFLLTNHLAAVCNSGNTAPGVTFTATSSFSSLFGSPITNQIPGAVGITGLANLANYLAGLTNGPIPQAISYISPDWTSIDSQTSSAKLSNGLPSPLLVASLRNGASFYLPTATNIRSALNHVKVGINQTPPANATDGANPLKWVPIVQIASTGYPVVGYSTLEVPQCYASKAISKGMEKFLHDHYTAPAYTKIQGNNGLVAVADGPGAKFLNAIRSNIIANKNHWNVNVGNPTACAGLPGR
jgi:phosphate transport system substrate-binding protein